MDALTRPPSGHDYGDHDYGDALTGKKEQDDYGTVLEPGSSMPTP